ncbi:MAG: DUF1566 domain-containing protein [Candidatus Nanopelagicales bacterium]
MSADVPVRSRLFLAIGCSLVMVAGMLFGANVASGDEVWNQSYQRGSQSEECVAQPGETPWQTSWGTDSSWKPSWEQWANGGEGGWTCTRSITWARTPASSGSSAPSYALGDIGPGGGLVFLISGGLTYEMAPKTWAGGAGGAPDPKIAWCNVTGTDIDGAAGTAIGTGSANTTAMQAACTTGAAVSARAYTGGGQTDWFLPSKDELNAMNGYKGSIVDTTTYGFEETDPDYWTSSQSADDGAWSQTFSGSNSDQTGVAKTALLRVRPVRAF